MTTRVAKRWPTLRVLLSAHLPFTAILWAFFMVVVLVITTVLVFTRADSDNIMQTAAIQAPRWLLFGLGIDAISTYLRMHLAHGRTRREFTGQALGYAVLLSGFAAALITVGYLIEYALHNVLGWMGGSSNMERPNGLHEFPELFGTFWLSLLMWTVVGLLIGLGFFRSPALGLLTIPVGAVIVLPSITNHRAGLPFIGNPFVGLDLRGGEMIGASAGLLVLGAVLVWSIARRVPMKAMAE